MAGFRKDLLKLDVVFVADNTASTTRVVVLIGDNSAHEPGHPKNPRNISAEQLIRTARGLGVRLFGLCVQGGGDADERRRHEQQWRTLAEGTNGSSREAGAR